MMYKFYCVTCGNKLITTCNAEVGDPISEALDPKFKEHKDHDCTYHPVP